MCQTQATTKPARTCSWTIPVCDTPSGGRLGFFSVLIGRKRDFYRATLQESDDLAQAWEVSKELPSGEFAEPYRVVLPTPGGFGSPVCSCPGWRWAGSCRHGSALQTLLSRCLR